MVILLMIENSNKYNYSYVKYMGHSITRRTFFSQCEELERFPLKET